MKKKLLIASTYYENKNSLEVNPVWLRLQTQFFWDTTNNYDFAVYLNQVTRQNIFKGLKIIGESDISYNNETLSHRNAIREIFNYFRSHKDDYSFFVLLDSDCFPIRQGWIATLSKILQKYNYKFASIVRYENGETYPHPSAMFIPSENIDEELFMWPETAEVIGSYSILDGEKIRDTGSNNSFWVDGKMIGHPLIRTNVINLHPVLAGIYGDVFYHHGLGSRVTNNLLGVSEPKRTYRSKVYWANSGKAEYIKNVSILYDLLVKSPLKFIDNLRGKNLNYLSDFNKLMDFRVPEWNF